MKHLADLPLWLDLLVATLLVLGAGFAVVGSIGLAKLSDFYKRLHGPSKATTLGVGCVLIASLAVFGWHGQWSLRELLITLFLFLSAPVTAHVLVKAVLASKPDDVPAKPGSR
jgi:multicomponent K+:H+ antiporter subunit G